MLHKALARSFPVNRRPLPGKPIRGIPNLILQATGHSELWESSLQINKMQLCRLRSCEQLFTARLVRVQDRRHHEKSVNALQLFRKQLEQCLSTTVAGRKLRKEQGPSGPEKAAKTERPSGPGRCLFAESAPDQSVFSNESSSSSDPAFPPPQPSQSPPAPTAPRTPSPPYPLPPRQAPEPSPWPSPAAA